MSKTTTAVDDVVGSSPPPALTTEQEEGVKMIILLQGMARITETPEDALKGWNSMSDAERATTKEVFNLFFGPK